MCLFFSQKVSNLKLPALYESVLNHRLLCLQWRLVRPSQILDKVLTSLYPPASGTSGVWPFLQALALTLPTAPLLYLTRVRPRSLLQRGPRYTFKSQAIARQTTDSSQAGRAIAALPSLPIKPEGSNKEACLENFKNKVVYINSFTVSQKDMLESALRVTGTKEDDWTIAKEPAQERYSNGIKEIQEGKRIGFAKMSSTTRARLIACSTCQRRTLMKQPRLRSSARRFPPGAFQTGDCKRYGLLIGHGRYS